MQNSDLMDGFNKFEEGNPLTESLEKLLSKEDIELKTEIVNPPALSSLKSLADNCYQVGFMKTGQTIEDHILTLNEFMVSYKRKGRTEYVDAFKSVNSAMTPEFNISDKLTKNLKEEK